MPLRRHTQPAMASVLAAVFVAGALLPVRAEDPESTAHKPLLVTFGPRAAQSEGDHDYRQLVRISAPSDAGRLYIRVYDPDVGGAHDEPLAGFDTQTRFSLYGNGSETTIYRDPQGVVQETVTGEPVGSVEFRSDSEADGQWVTLFTVDASDGVAMGEAREFVLAIEGVSGNDGNVFDVFVSRQENENVAPHGTSVYSYVPTFQSPEEGVFVELRFRVPQDADALDVENFDAARGEIAYGGRFRSLPLGASNKSEWIRDRITLEADEPGRLGSVTFAGGNESPNDLTVFAGAPMDGANSVAKPVPVELPLRVFAFNRRPLTSFNKRQTACLEMRFGASASIDPDTDPLTHFWRFDGEGPWIPGAVLTHVFVKPGDHTGRLEVFDDTGMVASGDAFDFSFYVKPRPVAAFENPSLAAQDAEVQFDATASSTVDRPAGNHIVEYHWDFGDGDRLIQREGDPDFGKPVHAYRKFGDYTIGLTVVDSADNPCNTGSITGTIEINAPPVADAGGDRELLTGEIAKFDASASHDPDGSVIYHHWNFGDGAESIRQVTEHAWRRPGAYQVTLSVLDDSAFDTARDSETITVTVRDAANMEPQAVAGADRAAAVGKPFALDASGSADSDGSVLVYDWDFGDATGANTPKVSHTYWEPGAYPVTLKIRDNDKGEAIDTLVVTVAPPDNRAPLIDFPSRFRTMAHEPLRFDASEADDRDGSIIAFEWDFGDGTFGLGPVIEHRYDAPGVYDAKLTLTDNGVLNKQSSTIGFQVDVAHRPNERPIADAGEDVTTVAGSSIALSAAGSNDPDGSIIAYEWDFGDGNRSTGVGTRHIYQFPGTYRVGLKITDDGRSGDRLEHEDSITITVLPAENIEPVAIAAGELLVGVQEIVRFDGSPSYDPDGNIMRYQWDFGDGGNSSDRRPYHAFHDPGDYEVRLVVTDDGEEPKTNEAAFTVTVREAGAKE
ncbi:PKD domain-containing protein [Hoeflea sp. CAU 1731]